MLATLVAMVVVAWSTGGGAGAASSTTTVSMDVTSSTVLDANGCAPGMPDRTSFGTVQPGTGMVTGVDCDVLFGSSNDSSTLRAYQSDGSGSGMSTPPTTLSGSGSTTGDRTLDLDMGSPLIGWASTDGSSPALRLWKTVDGGVTWTGVNDIDVTQAAEGVDAVSTSVAWTVGNNTNYVARTSDGSDWVNATGDLPATVAFNEVSGVSSTTAFAAGYVTIAAVNYAAVYRTTNGGTNWTQVFQSVDASTEAVGVKAFGGGQTWVGQSNGKVMYSPNGNPGSFAQSGGNPLGAMAALTALTPDKVAAVNGSGTIMFTTNGTVATPTWSTRSVLERGLILDLAWSSDDQLWAVGAKGSIQRSSDAGFTTWTTVANPHEASMFRTIVSPAPGQYVVAASGRTIIATADTGSTWTVWRGAGGGSNFAAVTAATPARLWRVGQSGLLETSTNAGSTWSAQASTVSVALWDVAALDRSIALAVGANGTIIRTTNGGTTWTVVPSGVASRLRRVTFSTDGTAAFAAGDDGVLLRSTNRGASWHPISSGVTAPILTVAAWSRTSIVIGTSDVQVRTTTDGGATWTPRASGANEAIADGVVVPGTNTIVLLYDDNSATSTDGGVTWSTTEMSGSGQMYELDLGDATTLWAGGQYGRVQRTTNLGASWSSSMAGTQSGHNEFGVAALGPGSVVTVNESGRRDRTVEGTTVPDYTGTQWGSGTGLFGICLRAAPGALNTWPTTGSCPQSDGTYWRAVPLDPSVGASKVGDLTGPGTTTASFRFGLYAPTAQAPGSYEAPVSFELIAPMG